MAYKGIQKLCFSCGCVGHQKDAYPFTIWEGKEPMLPKEMDQGNLINNSCTMHEACRSDSNSATPTESGVEEAERQYGPWMVVSRKRNRHKTTKKDVSSKGPTKSSWRSAISHSHEGPIHVPKFEM